MKIPTPSHSISQGQTMDLDTEISNKTRNNVEVETKTDEHKVEDKSEEDNLPKTENTEKITLQNNPTEINKNNS
jgi:hypothetical protein